MVTREEKHSTRGRARLLFEMLRGDPLARGFSEDYVEEALDLCLACKGCKSECPVNVDIATYKAEFLDHHYRGRLRPRSAYLFGYIHQWLRLARFVPVLANALTRLPFVGWIAGIARARKIPLIAPETFRRWFSRRFGQIPSTIIFIPKLRVRRCACWKTRDSRFRFRRARCVAGARSMILGY
jgi:Fe-S oxidoreductase